MPRRPPTHPDATLAAIIEEFAERIGVMIEQMTRRRIAVELGRDGESLRACSRCGRPGHYRRTCRRRR